jgi:MoaA/NifB/PqqE/SkfB family radical SAM enzyme
MFPFNELKSVHLEITTRCQASCPMCSRNYRGGKDNPNLVLADWTTQDFTDILSPTILQQLEGLYFCGNFGDPIVNHHLIDMCDIAATANPNIVLRIHTNGGARTQEWWQDLAAVMPKNHVVIFGIDGLEDTHHLYRVGTTYENVIRNAQAFIDAGGTAEWVFIKFKHNEHQVDIARQRAKELGFARFTVKNSTRFMEPKFAVLDKQGRTQYHLEPPTDNRVILIDVNMIGKFRTWMNTAEIDCYVQGNREVYIDAHKTLFPCCFLASTPYNYIEPGSVISPIKEQILDQYHELVADLGSLNLIERSMQEIIDSPAWQTTWAKYWNDKKLITCARTCGTTPISKPKDQFIERISFE